MRIALARILMLGVLIQAEPAMAHKVKCFAAWDGDAS